MNTLFDTGLRVIIFLSVVFFVIFSYVCLMWSNRKMASIRHILAGVSVSLLHTFKIVVLSVILLALASLVEFVAPQISGLF